MATNKTILKIISGNHGNKQNCIKVSFDTYKEDGNRNIGFLENYLGQFGFPWH